MCALSKRRTTDFGRTFRPRKEKVTMSNTEVGRIEGGDRVRWTEAVPGYWWDGHVDGVHTYNVLVVGEPGPGAYPVWVGRVGTRMGCGCTNVSRAMDLAELNERIPLPRLMHHGLALPA
jgi:hypothetical protein